MAIFFHILSVRSAHSHMLASIFWLWPAIVVRISMWRRTTTWYAVVSTCRPSYSIQQCTAKCWDWKHQFLAFSYDLLSHLPLCSALVVLVCATIEFCVMPNTAGSMSSIRWMPIMGENDRKIGVSCLIGDRRPTNWCEEWLTAVNACTVFDRSMWDDRDNGRWSWIAHIEHCSRFYLHIIRFNVHKFMHFIGKDGNNLQAIADYRSLDVRTWSIAMFDVRIRTTFNTS